MKLYTVCILFSVLWCQCFSFMISDKRDLRRFLERTQPRGRAPNPQIRDFYVRALEKRTDAAGKVSFKECQLSESAREDCGYFGITENECYTRGCCWGMTQAFDVPWCYHSTPTMLPKCVMDNTERVECGNYGIRKETCMAKDCCWQPTNEPSTPWCFHEKREPLFAGECGVPAINPNVVSRIVGGVEANPSSWPWMTSLRQDGGHFCGGSLLNSQWVLTAAHCQPGFKEAEGGSKTVVLGNHFNSEQDPYEVEVAIEAIIPHEDYSDSTYQNDIMLLKLVEPVEMNDGVSPVCLPPAGEDYIPGRHCYSTGWGHTQWMGMMPETLQQVMVPLIDRDECNGQDWYNGKIDTTMICAGYEEGGRDSCQGDSGGPLVCYNHDDETWQLTGVVSWGEACAYERRPGIYNNVGQFIQWIDDTITSHT